MASYLFIDGNYLRNQVEKQMQTFYGVVPALDYTALAAALGGQRTYYYDAIDYAQRPGETDIDSTTRIAAREALHDHISSRPGLHVREVTSGKRLRIGLASRKLLM